MAIFQDKELHKEIESLKNNLGALEQKQDTLNEQLKVLITLVGEIKTSLSSSEEQKEQASVKINQEVSKIISTSEELDRALRSFKDLQNRIEHYSFEKINEGITKSLDELKKDTQQYTDAKADINDVVGKIDSLKVEINKFLTISRNISETDFELREYVKTLTVNDHEKLKLMKEIDSLQRLVSSLRRKVRA